MREAIEAGSILIEGSALVPDYWLPPGEPYTNGWVCVGKRDRPELEASIHEAGWTFFCLAGEIKAAACGFDKQRMARKAVKRLIAGLKARRLNCLEITRVTPSSWLGVPYVTVTAHARHIQEHMVLPNIRRQPGQITDEPLFAEAAVAAWEDEGGAEGHMGGRLAA
jgi:hypothetical protein